MKKLALICEAFGRGRGRGRGDGCETMRKLLAAFALTALLTGCVTTQWAHPAFAGKQGAEDEAKIARAQCRAYARGIGPAPVAPTYMPVPAATSYSTTGTYQSYGSTGTFNAITTANPSYASSFASGYNSGAALGAGIANMIAAAQTEELADACMRRLGWIDVGTAEGKAELQKRATSSQAKTKTDTQHINYVDIYLNTKLTHVGTTDTLSLSTGTFDTASTFGQNTIGVISEMSHITPAAAINGRAVDDLIMFFVFDCSAEKTASVGHIGLMRNEVVSSGFAYINPTFSTVGEAERNVFNATCRAQTIK